MSYITRYLLETTKDEIITNLRNVNNKLEFVNIKKLKIGNFIISGQKKGYIYGKIAVQRLYEDYYFDLTDDFEIETKLNEMYVYDEVMFIY